MRRKTPPKDQKVFGAWRYWTGDQDRLLSKSKSPYSTGQRWTGYLLRLFFSGAVSCLQFTRDIHVISTCKFHDWLVRVLLICFGSSFSRCLKSSCWLGCYFSLSFLCPLINRIGFGLVQFLHLATAIVVSNDYIIDHRLNWYLFCVYSIEERLWTFFVSCGKHVFIYLIKMISFFILFLYRYNYFGTYP